MLTPKQGENVTSGLMQTDDLPPRSAGDALNASSCFNALATTPLGIKQETAIADEFDAVLMLTWSDWWTEPRSNRYHYATRLANLLPVLFLQHRYQNRQQISVKKTEVPNLDVVEVSKDLLIDDVEELKILLYARGIRRPLVWLYDSMHYWPLINRLPAAFFVYHATEDYLTNTAGWNQQVSTVRESVLFTLERVHLVIACSQGVARSIRTNGGYDGPCALVPNGCDAEFHLDLARRWSPPKGSSEQPIAIFQGGINNRLDYRLLCSLVDLMPEWAFRFVGRAEESEGWQELRERPNVTHLGSRSAEEVTEEMLQATVGLIPYIQDDWIAGSFPLKAYEYVACGLPVVTVPVVSLEDEPELFAFARSADDFSARIRALAPTRHDQEMIKRRQTAALGKSYSSRFPMACEAIRRERSALRGEDAALNVAVLYDSVVSLHVQTIREHLSAFDRYSRHKVTYISATSPYWSSNEKNIAFDLNVFDVVVVHYSIRMSLKEHFSDFIASRLEDYGGLKVLFLQDEYEGLEIARGWLDSLRFDVVYTCVPPDGIDWCYPAYRYPGTAFVSTLTGYLPNPRILESYVKPLEERSVLIGYRGRRLPPRYGWLGYEKYIIGERVKEAAQRQGIRVDIETADSERIYGRDWYRFLGGVRATLGTESGCNLFDFDGSVQTDIDRWEKAHPGGSFEELWEDFLKNREGPVRTNQISPKVFEAITLRTALILFEGDYSGVVKPDVHYIPLKKDFSNLDDVFRKVRDLEYLHKLTDRAYQDIVVEGRYGYRDFVEGFDELLAEHVIWRKKRPALIAPLLTVSETGHLEEVLPALPVGVAAGFHPLGQPLSTKELSERLSGRTSVRDETKLQEVWRGFVEEPSYEQSIIRAARRNWHRMPPNVRLRLLCMVHAAHQGGGWWKTVRPFVRGAWHLLPRGLRWQLAARLGLL